MSENRNSKRRDKAETMRRKHVRGVKYAGNSTSRSV